MSSFFCKVSHISYNFNVKLFQRIDILQFIEICGNNDCVLVFVLLEHVIVQQSSSKKIPLTPTLQVSLFLSFFLSGAGGLVFEIVLRRQLLLSLGVMHYSVGTVLTVFMAGLGIGSIIFGKLADKTTHPLLLYALLEMGIGLFGFMLLALLPFLDRWYTALAALGVLSGSALIPLKAGLAGFFLLPLTVLMGGTLPAIGKALAGEEAKFFLQSGERRRPGSLMGILYGINTLGGVAGILAATFWFLGIFGARKTLVSFSALSLAIGLLFAIVCLQRSRRCKTGSTAIMYSFSKPENKKRTGRSQGSLALIAIFVSGFIGLSLEVYWTRILAYIIGSHGYAFGVMLTSFITGIAIGSLAASRFADRAAYPKIVIGALLILLGASVVFVTMFLYQLYGLVEQISAIAAGRWNRFITIEMGVVFAIFFIPTLLLGALFPIVIAATAKSTAKLGTYTGRAYAVNTAGSILGSFSSSFVLIPLVGIRRGIQILIVFAVATGIAVLVLSFPDRTESVSKKRFRLSPAKLQFSAPLLAIGAAAVAVAFFFPFGSALQKLGQYERLLFYEESSSATVAVREDSEGGKMLSINGLDEVPVDVSSLLTFRMLSHLPLMLHPDPRDVMVLSLGGAVTTGSVASYPVTHIDAVDLCPPVVDAASFFEKWNHGVLKDPRLNVVFQDGRNYLLTINKNYDVITADATHPWSADSWMLYTREFYDLVKTRLAKNGIFCQWIPLHWLSPQDYRCILRTMHAVFPEMSLWYTGSYTIALASPEPHSIDNDVIARKMKIESVRADLESVGIESPESMIALYLMNESGIERYVGEGVQNTDDLAYLEHSASRCFALETTPENLKILLRYREQPEGLPPSNTFDDLFRAREKIILGRIATYEGNFERARRFFEYALSISPGDTLSMVFLDDVLNTIAAAATAYGDRLRNEGQIDEALAAYLEALVINSEAPGAHYGIGMIDLSNGNYSQALSHFDQALKMRIKDADVRSAKTEALIGLGLLYEAEREIEAVKQLEIGMEKRYSDKLVKVLHDAKGSTDPVFYLFHSYNCSRCADAKVFLEELKLRYPEIEFIVLEIVKNRDNQVMFNDFAEKLGINTPGVPVFIFGESYIVGFPEGKRVKKQIKSMIETELKMLQF
jgi:spermidine synthase